ncbi:MAG: class II fructose-1,6-bisphosphate aldolase [candidate division WOR-3 bacterium]|nr:MAG: class II fructose-1,6-bisphosphate aldolase [candidate division WOR-3 bacterium]
MLVNLNDILSKARKGRYAVGAFNTSNLEITQAILRAAEDLRSPVIAATSEKAIRYAGIENISQMVIGMAKRTKIPVVLHLDHGKSYELCRECIRHGYTSVMIDASNLEFKENVELTKKVVRYARKRGVSVEAEIGRLAGIEDDLEVKESQAMYTDPDEARRFAEDTGCDALAVAIGTSHGAYKFKGKPKLRIDILKEIAGLVKTPLVLHGASGVKSRWINYVNRYGGNMEHARGVPDALIHQAVENGITKINTDTDLRIAFTAGVREYLTNHPSDFDPRKITAQARKRITDVVLDRIEVFGSGNKA